MEPLQMKLPLLTHIFAKHTVTLERLRRKEPDALFFIRLLEQEYMTWVRKRASSCVPKSAITDPSRVRIP